MPNYFGQHLIVLLQRLEDRPHFIELCTSHRLLNSFSLDLLKEQRYQHIACRLLCGGTLPHGASRRLDYIHEAPFGREERDHIHRWDIDPFSQAASVRNKRVLAFGKRPHDRVSLSTRHHAVHVKCL